MGVVLKLSEGWLMEFQMLDIYILMILVIIGLGVYFSLAFWTGFLPSGLIKKASQN
jgi:hypothetical protein